MKKAVVFFVVAMMIVVSCAAQSSNVTQKIVGSWTDSAGRTWVFSADGKLTIPKVDDVSPGTYDYGVADTKLAIVVKAAVVFDISISPDGKILIMNRGYGNGDGFGFLLKNRRENKSA
jgi:archaellum component FlaG (FlaF/FlaG flagellin family)